MTTNVVRTILLLPVIWLSLVSACFAQAGRMELLSAEQGLSQGMIYDLIQDRTGFIWFGTRDGLNRFDGYRFKVYKNDPFNPFSISDNLIKILKEDPYGRMWIGTENNGVDVLDLRTEKFYHLSTGENGLSNQTVLAMDMFPNGDVWVGTNFGLCRVRLPETLPADNYDLRGVAQIETYFWETEKIHNSAPNAFSSIVCAVDGMMWVGTYQAAYKFDPKTRTRTLLPVNKWVDIPNLFANNFEQAPNEEIWLGQFSRFSRFRNDGITQFPLPPQELKYSAFLSFDKDGNLFVSRRKHILRYDKQQLDNYAPGKPLNPEIVMSFPEKDVIGVTKMMSDRNNIIWIGTNGYGIRKFNAVNQHFKHYMPGISARKIVADSKGNIWAWTSSGFFLGLDAKGNLEDEPVLPGAKYFHHDCIFGRDSMLWLLAQRRDGLDGNSILLRKNLKTGAIQKYENLVVGGMYSQLMEDKSGNIWIIGAQSDLIRLEVHANTWQSYDISAVTGFKEKSFVIQEDQDGCIWIGTPHGLVCGTPDPAAKDNKTLRFSLFKNNPKDRNSLNSNVILSILDDPSAPSQYLWLATRGGGLNHMDKKTGACRHFSTPDGLPNDVIYGILTDDEGCLWLSTNSGLSKFNPNTESFENYSVADGLQDNEFNTTSYFKTAQGNLLFGGVNGITMFDPRNVSPVFSTPPVLITQLKIQNKIAEPGDGTLTQTIEQTKSVSLKYFQNTITLEFVAFDFTASQKNQFRYRLLGSQNDWSEATTEHRTTYSNLAPGRYVFEVITGGAHSVWKGQPCQLEIIVLPPWWRSNLAYACYLFFLLAMGYKLFKMEVNRVKLQEQLTFEHREADRIRSLEQMKTNFFSDITHELRTPLTLILEPLRQIIRNPDEKDWLSKVRMAAGNSHKLQHLVNQLLDLAKLEAGAIRPVYSMGDFSELVGTIIESFADQAQREGIVVTANAAEPAIPQFCFDADKVGKIIVNLLSNAFKFTPAHGAVTLKWQVVDGAWLQFDVADTGSGIAASDLPHVFDRFFSKNGNIIRSQPGTGIGLALSKELAELMGGRIVVESREGAGATFRLTIPFLRPCEESGIAHEASSEIEHYDAPVENSISTPVVAEPKGSVSRPLLLLVEDNAELRSFIAQTLRPYYTVIEAKDGQEAVEIARERLPDIVVSDLMMPTLDGIGVLDALKNDELTSHIPILMLTAKKSLEHRLNGLQHGADAYLGKPFLTEELLLWIDNLVESRRRLRALFAKPGVQATADLNGAPLHDSEIPAPEMTLGILDQHFLDRLQDILEVEIGNENLNAEDISRKMALSRSQLHRKLVALTGQSTMEYLRHYRLDRAMELLKKQAGNISEVAWNVGFANPKHFSTSFKERFGVSPSEIK